jgi:hypothetical protein
MRHFSGFIFCLLIPAHFCTAEPKASNPVVNIYLARGGEQLTSPHVVTYRMFEWSQMRGKWILPDIGYYDNGNGKDQIWFAGGGADFVRRKHFTWEQEIYLTQEAGEEAHNQRSLWGWTVLDFRLKHRLSGEAVGYPTVPLDRAQGWGYDIDRAKLERAAGRHWLAGVGYAGGLCSGDTWQSKPFVTVTRKTRAGNFEFWLQSIPGGRQVQFRYLLIRSNKD